MKKIVGVKGAYIMLGKVGENKNYLLQRVHPEMAWMAPSWTSALMAIGSLQPIPWASHCAFYNFSSGLFFGFWSFIFSFLVWSFVWTLILSIFFSYVVFCLDFGPFIFFSCSLANCFSFYLFTYPLVDFLKLSMPNPYKPYVQVVNLPKKSLQLLSYLVSRGLPI